MKACWADTTLLPGNCVFDTAETYNCTFANSGEVASKEDCKHWIPELSIQLCYEILGAEGFCGHCKTDERCE